LLEMPCDSQSLDRVSPHAAQALALFINENSKITRAAVIINLNDLLKVETLSIAFMFTDHI